MACGPSRTGWRRCRNARGDAGRALRRGVIVIMLATMTTGLSMPAAGLLAGAASKVLRDVVLHPVDTLRTRRVIRAKQQSRDGAPAPTGTDFAGLYDGLIPTVITGAPAGALYLYISDVLRAEGFDSAASGAVASVVFWTTRTPGEVLKTRLQLAQAQGTVTAGELVAQILDDADGPRGFFRGYWPTLARALPFDALRFSLFDHLRDIADPGHESILTDTACGFVASAAAAVMTQPLDVLKTLTQGVEGADSALAVVSELSALPKGTLLPVLYAGLPERMLMAACSGAIYFGAYDTLKRVLLSL